MGCKTETALVVSDVSTLTEEEASQASHLPIPTESPTSFDLLLDDDIAALEVIVQRWTYQDEDEDLIAAEETTEEGPEHYYDDTAGLFSGEKEIPSGSEGPSEKKISISSADDRTYVNIQKDLNASAHLSLTEAGDLSEKEKKFFEEDEDAG